MIEFLRRYWLLALVFLLPFERIPSFDWSVLGVSFTVRLSYVVVAIALAALGWQVVRAVPWLSPKQPYFWLVSYGFVAILSVLQALNVKRGLVALVATGLVMATCVLVSRSVKRLDWMALFRAMTIGAVIACAVGVFQFFGDSLGLSTHLTGLREIYTKGVFGFPRIQATGLEPLYFANFLLIPFLVTFGLIYSGRLTRWWYGLLFLYAYIMSLTLSRGAIWGSIAGLIFIAIMLATKTHWKRAAVGLGMIALGGAAAIGSIYAVTQHDSKGGSQAVVTYTRQSTTFTPSSGSADSDRTTNKKLALAAFRERPLLGFGLGNFGTYAKGARPELYGKTGGEVTVNNEYLEVMAETGLLGLGTLVGLFVTLLVAARKAWRRLAAQERVWLISLMGVLGAFAIQYYAFSTLYVMHIWVVIGLTMGLVVNRSGDEATS